MSLFRVRYYIIRTANRNNGNFYTLITKKNFQRHTRCKSQIVRNNKILRRNNKRLRDVVLTLLVRPIY